MAVTIKDVALHAQVSRSAVSRTFTDGASVSDKMRKKVEKSSDLLGYRPNLLARSLTTNRTKLIGLISNNYKNPFFFEIFDLFTRGLQDIGLRPLLVNLTNDEDPKACAELLAQYSVDAVIFMGSELHAGFSTAIRQKDIPVVHSFGRPADDVQVHTISVDDKQCGQVAAQTLLKLGYKSVGFIGGGSTMQVINDRLIGFETEIAKHPDIKFCKHFAGTHSFVAGRNTMQKILEKPHADAYFFSDDILSIGAISAIQDAGLSVPNDIGVIGMNNMEMAGWNNISLTTIHQPTAQIVSSTIELVEAIMEDQERHPETRLFSCMLVERSTLRSNPKN
ncbi:MAG: LacI family DNA-binding transcriptional regulator [Rhizobiales bacterium]|nr:LacI family DNA-binding transcriptional regulator [Hyphomicrobiales bacterium]